NYSISYDLTKPIIAVIYPINGSYYNSQITNVDLLSLNEPGSCLFNLDGLTNYTLNTTNNLSFYNTYSGITSGAHNLTYYCNDRAGNMNASNLIWFNVDLIPPNVTLQSPLPESETSNSVEKMFYYNASDNLNISSCSLIVNNAFVASNASAIGNETNNISSTFTPGTYVWQINCTDIAGNIGNSSSSSFTISAVPTPPSSGGGGGGGGGGSIGSTYNIGTLTFTSTGGGGGTGNASYTREASGGDSIKFEIPSSFGDGGFGRSGSSISIGTGGESHTLKLEKVTTDYVNMTLRSSPINFVIVPFEEKKFNLTSSEYYDLLVRLNGIKNGRANLTITSINELIHPKINPISNSTDVESNDSEGQEYKFDNNPPDRTVVKIIVLIIVIMVVAFVIVFFARSRARENLFFEDPVFRTPRHPHRHKRKKY
ncbi:MAG: hypothetical protein WCK90_05825, partial [archaeon]